MRIVGPLLLVLAATSAAQAQSLLGDSGASPYDPPPRRIFQKRDHLRVVIPAGNRPAMDAWVRFDRSKPPAAADAAITISAEVVDIRPNGVLVVQAIQRRQVNDGQERLRLTGEVAPEAVRGDAVAFDRVVHLSVSYEGGASAPAAGWILGRLWPF